MPRPQFLLLSDFPPSQVAKQKEIIVFFSWVQFPFGSCDPIKNQQIGKSGSDPS